MSSSGEKTGDSDDPGIKNYIENATNLMRKYLSENSFSRSLADEGSYTLLVDYYLLLFTINIPFQINAGNLLVENLASCAACGLLSMDKIEEAQEVGKKFMELEKNRKNFQNQKNILKFQDVLLEMAMLVSRNSDPQQEPEDEKKPTIVRDEKKPTIVRRFTKSLVQVEEIHSCSVCEKQYQSFKSLGKHHRQKHPNEAPLSFKQYTNRNAVICLAAKKNFPKLQCRKQVEKDRFVRHLKEVHSIERPANKEFRGFTYTCSVSNPPDDKEIKYSVCWRSRTEYNPPDEELIEATKEVEQENNGQIEEAANAQENFDEDQDIREELAFVDTENQVVEGDSMMDEGMNRAPVESGELRKNDFSEDLDRLLPSSPGSCDLQMNIDDEEYTLAELPVEIEESKITLVDVNSDGSFHLIENYIENASSSFGSLPSDSSSDNYIDSQESIFISAGFAAASVEDNLLTPKSASPLKSLNQRMEEDTLCSLQEIMEEETEPEDESEEEDIAEDNDSQEDDVPNARWEKRNYLEPTEELHEKKENQQVIEEFNEWWKTSGASYVTKNKETSSVRLNNPMLFTNKDSFLNFQTKEDKCFSLSRLLKFEDSEFLPVPSPVPWITKVGGPGGQDMPSRRKSMLTCHARLRAFINFKLNQHKFEGAQIQQKEAIGKHLKAIDDQVAEKKIHGQLEKLYNLQVQKKAQMENVVKPFEKTNIHNAVKNWFNSKQSEDLEIEALDIYQNSMRTQTITNKQYDRFAQIVFFELVLFDRSRVGKHGELTNADYAMKKETWIPEDMVDLELENLPEGWNLHAPPYPGAPVSSYQIELLGDHKRDKNQDSGPVCISLRVYELVEKMRDLKSLIIQDIKLEDYLFVNAKNKQLPVLRNYPSSTSLLYQFGLVTGVKNFSLKMLRKGAEGHIQNSASLAVNTKALNSHSQKVGAKVYDQMNASRRNLFITNLGKKDGVMNLRVGDKTEDAELKKREERDNDEKNQLVLKAEQYLIELKNQEPWDERPSSIKNEDVEFLRKIFKADMLGKNINSI